MVMAASGQLAELLQRFLWGAEGSGLVYGGGGSSLGPEERLVVQHRVVGSHQRVSSRKVTRADI